MASWFCVYPSVCYVYVRTYYEQHLQTYLPKKLYYKLIYYYYLSLIIIIFWYYSNDIVHLRMGATTSSG